MCFPDQIISTLFTVKYLQDSKRAHDFLSSEKKLVDMVSPWFDKNPRLAILDLFRDGKCWTFLRGMPDGIERQPDESEGEDEWLRYQGDNYVTKVYP